MSSVISYWLAAPVTMIFKDGEMVNRVWGKMSAEDLHALVGEGKEPVKGPDYVGEIRRLFAQKGEIITLYEKLPMINARIEELQKILMVQ